MAVALGGPYGNTRPTARLRNAVGSAIGSLSRHRRGSSVDDLMVTDGPVNNVPNPAAPEPPVATEPPVAMPRTPAPVPEQTTSEVTACVPAARPAPCEPDLAAVARLCTALGKSGSTTDVETLLQEAARILDATGLIVWLWDAAAAHLIPTLVHGYSDKVVAQLPWVERDANNLTAAAFRSAETCAIGGSHHTKGALVVPLLTSAGCAGVLAIELQRGGEQTESVRAVATIFAALLAQFTGSLETAEMPPQLVTEAPRWERRTSERPERFERPDFQVPAV